MARKGILPRRKRGRASILPIMNNNIPRNNNTGVGSSSTDPNVISAYETLSTSNVAEKLELTETARQHSNSRSTSPAEPPFHFAHYKLPELRPKLV